MQKNNFLNKNIKSGHSRVSLSGIFDARRCSYEIGKTLLHKRPLRGRSPITAFGDDDPYVYERQTARVEDPETSSGIPNFIMPNTARGFTLIELLVVVLIIGILAAVALPQYQFAVAKARATELITTANSIVQAQERYYLANNTYTDQLENLDIDFPQANKDGGHLFITLYLAQASYPDLVKVEDNRLKDIFLMFGYPHTSWDSWKGARYCYALKTNDLANKLCAHIANNSAKDDNGGGHWMYKMQ